MINHDESIESFEFSNSGRTSDNTVSITDASAVASELENDNIDDDVINGDNDDSGNDDNNTADYMSCNDDNDNDSNQEESVFDNDNATSVTIPWMHLPSRGNWLRL